MKPRPQVIAGKTYRIETGAGAVFAIINDDHDGPFEMFLTVGKSGGLVASMTEALGRVISLALRCGAPPVFIAKQLFGIRSPRHTMYAKEMVWSIPHAVAMVLLAHLGLTPESLDAIRDDPSDTDTVEPML